MINDGTAVMINDDRDAAFLLCCCMSEVRGHGKLAAIECVPRRSAS